ncbi:replication initiator protein A [Mediterraneibacter glycyrrhizinilyticus]|nr:replication initiator protein A [Mediterraneibacter glycyrrhizinilyticus]MCF2568223.1 replication initiator protein A [Mediterraneibacter glycyrrhizinilyticus]
MTEFLTVDTNLPPYLVFPRFLLDMELNETTKLLYMILLDRARLSLRNEGWTDASGHVFLYFTIEAMSNVLQKSQMTIKTSLAALESKGLILRKRQGAGHPNQIYVKFPKDAFRETDRILSPRQTENCPYDRQDSFPETDRKLSGNKKERKKNDLSKRESQEDRSPYGNFQNVFLSAKELENVRQTVPNWQDYIERLSGYIASTGKQYQNHAATIISWALQDNPPSRQKFYESEEYETL